MSARVVIPRLRRKVTVSDLFAGAGGTSEGVRLAEEDEDDFELDLVFAANHWPLAVELHARRHPGAKHVCQDLTQYDFRRMPRTDILWASPACQGHSEAAQPARLNDEELAAAHDYLRSSAWAVIQAVLARQPRAFVVENVPQFVEWAPSPILLERCSSVAAAERRAVVARGEFGPERVKIVKRAAGWDVLRTFEPGSLYRHWLNTFRLGGWNMTEQFCTASKWGVPQRRCRLIVVGHLDREVAIEEPVVEPADEPTLESILDFDAGEWAKISKISRPAARARARQGDRLFGGEPCWGWHASHPAAWARSPKQPANTITTQNQHYMVRDGEYRLWSVAETAQVMGFEPDYFDGVDRTAALVMAGNAVPPRMASGILRQVAATV